MKRRPKSHRTTPRQQDGFALPMALAAIALLSIITIAGYRAVTGAAEIAMRLQENAYGEQALFSAEAEATFTFLTSGVTTGGLITQIGETQELNPFESNIELETLGPSDYWRANGGNRLSAAASIPVMVSYYDAAGFPPVGFIPEEILARLLAAAGFERDGAERFAARIADYQDVDTNRRFRGAERADYRLFGAPPPANSPLRTTGELSSVLGFSEDAPYASWEFLLENARFGGIGTIFNPQFGPPAIAEILVEDRIGTDLNDPLDDLGAQNAQPSDTARFLLSYRTGTGLTRRRALEIMRTASAADKPFRRVWIYDKVDDDDVPATAADERGELAPVFQPAPAADQG